MTPNTPSSIVPYAHPRVITDLADCLFYHTMEIPGYGVVEGQWDLRGRERKYLGGVDLEGKRVLEVGTASGFVCFHMESRGADVVAYDLSERQSWEVVPFARYDHQQYLEHRKREIRRINNGWWLNHRARESKARMVYGTVYDIPEEIGDVDVVTFGVILLHVRDPFLALQRATSLRPSTVIVTEHLSARYSLPQIIVGKLLPGPVFLPDYRRCEPKATWWLLSPDLVRRMLGVLGFGRCEVSYHVQKYRGRVRPMFTVVAHRTDGG